MGEVAVFAADARDQRSGRRVKHSGVLPENGAARSIVPPMARADLNNNAGPENSRSVEEGTAESPLPWLANLLPAEYECLRRQLARERGWRVTFLDRLYREARRKAGAPR
jgi:hypothetical protein